MKNMKRIRSNVSKSERPSKIRRIDSRNSTVFSKKDVKYNALSTSLLAFEELRRKHNADLMVINKVQDRFKPTLVSSLPRTKLYTIYQNTFNDTIEEINVIKVILEIINEIKQIQYGDTFDKKLKNIVRRTDLMKMLHLSAQNLPMWMGNLGEAPPPLCGAIPPTMEYIVSNGTQVAALISTPEETTNTNWILGTIINFTAQGTLYKYTVVDIDSEEKKGVYVVGKCKIIPLPKWRANPYSHPEALFPINDIVNALYPQTTCFYRAKVIKSPKHSMDDYTVSFEDITCKNGFSPPLPVPQRYVISLKVNKKRNN
ncbi:Coiled-coil domain-containing protein [Intoshia linei]|uniref:Coiled-coil domain-containing protein n=1 Tax=Intoshia linei TaxID=1819745 RepID=A0A177B4M5_9BILA|nr:Coiled-coil domain-containing protein [Intoshia linei]